MKTILISSFHPLISRNIIATEFLSDLTAMGNEVVMLVPDYKRSFFERIYRRPGVRFEGVATGPAARSRWVRIAKRIAEALPNTRRAAIGRRRTLAGQRKSALVYWIFYAPLGLIGKSHRAVRWFRRLDSLLSPAWRFFSVLDRYRPALVFSTDIQNEHDVALMQDARRRGYPILGMVRSWDNLTTRALRFVPPHIVVHNEVIKAEAARYHGVRPDAVSVVGIPHYDRYLRGPTLGREEFFRRIGVSPDTKLVLYFPVCDYRLERNIVDPYVIGLLGKTDGITTLVRFPPAASVGLGDFVKPRTVVYDTPGHEFQAGRVDDRELTPEDDERLMNALRWCDVVVAGPSTAVIDAALFKKPVILVDFYPRDLPEEGRIYEYGAEHIMNILATEGARRVRSEQEFFAALRRYCDEPNTDERGRERIVREQCWRTDGKSCERIARLVGEYANSMQSASSVAGESPAHRGGGARKGQNP